MNQKCNEWNGKKIGRFKVICGGKYIISPDFFAFYITFFIILAPSIIQIIFVYTSFDIILTVVLSIIHLIIMIIDLHQLFVIATKDPGIIPREEQKFSQQSIDFPKQATFQGNTQQNNQQINRQEINNNENQQEFQTNNQFQNMKKEYYVKIKEIEIIIKECRTCNIKKPPRSFHCKRCDACIEIHDHHCPWVGTCVGKRNNYNFLQFLTITVILILMTMALDLVVLIKEYEITVIEINSSINYVAVAILVYAAGFGLSLLPFTLYHYKLAMQGKTTNEEIRNKYREYRGNPFNEGCKRNWHLFWNPGLSKILSNGEFNSQVDDFEIQERYVEMDLVDKIQ